MDVETRADLILAVGIARAAKDAHLTGTPNAAEIVAARRLLADHRVNAFAKRKVGADRKLLDPRDCVAMVYPENEPVVIHSPIYSPGDSAIKMDD